MDLSASGLAKVAGFCEYEVKLLGPAKYTGFMSKRVSWDSVELTLLISVVNHTDVYKVFVVGFHFHSAGNYAGEVSGLFYHRSEMRNIG